jgi:signal transduction histidine kinase
MSVQSQIKQPIGARPSARDELDRMRRRVAELEAKLASASLERDRAESANYALANVLGEASHELRTPLGALRLQLDRLLNTSKENLGVKEVEIVGRCLRSTRRINNLVDSLMEFAHIQRGRLEPRVDEFDLAVLVREIAGELEPLASQKDLRIAIAIELRTSVIRSDRGLVRLILLNLLANAVKAAESGVVQATLRMGESGFYLFSAGAPNRREPKNEGLSLTLAREMLAVLGGYVEINTGQGATIMAAIPSGR